MNITFTGRKVTPRDSFKAAAEKKLARLDKFFSKDAEARVTLSREKDGFSVEITIRSRGMVFRAEKMAFDAISALDATMETIVKQIVRNKSKLEHRGRGSVENFVFPEEYADSEVEAEDSYDVIKTKKFTVRDMTVEEAILQMNLIGHEFFIFSNVETGTINVVYKRKAGGYGLLDPEYE